MRDRARGSYAEFRILREPWIRRFLICLIIAHAVDYQNNELISALLNGCLQASESLAMLRLCCRKFRPSIKFSD